MTVSQTTGLLPLKDSADVMGTTPIGAQRLIARGRLKATRLGDDGDYRVRAADLDQYIASGAPDFDPPALSNADGNPQAPAWFDTPHWPSQQLSNMLAGLAVQQTSLSDSEFNRRAVAGNGGTIVVDVPLTAEMRSLLGGPVEGVAPRLPSGAPYAAKSAFDYWAADKLQSHALSQISMLPNTVSDPRAPIWKLFDSPQQYRQLVDAAIAAALQTSFYSTSEFRKRPDSVKNGAGDNGPVQVVYRGRVSDYTNAQQLRRIADTLAF